MREEERDVCRRVEQEVSLGNTKALRAWGASSEMLWRLGSHLCGGVIWSEVGSEERWEKVASLKRVHQWLCALLECEPDF